VGGLKHQKEKRGMLRSQKLRMLLTHRIWLMMPVL
jgi:hypothetical protein